MTLKRCLTLSISLLPVCALALSKAAYADTVQSTAVIYAAGTQAALAANAGGTVPNAIAVAAGAQSYTFAASGTISLNRGTGDNFNDADGFGGAVAQSSNSGYGGISGLVAPNDGYLVGVFLGAGGPGSTAPAALDFTAGGLGTSFSSLMPLLNQVFFIGDGLSGHGTGASQVFYVPKGATSLYLGISDAGGYNGGPGSYGDNSGAFNVTATPKLSTLPVGVTPEPSSFALLATGTAALLGAARRRFSTV